MKNKKFKMVAIVLLLLAGVVAWSPPNNEDLQVGASNYFDSPAGQSAAIGGSNFVRGSSVLIVGYTNNFASNGSVNSAVVGRNNQMALAGDSTLGVGQFNTMYAHGSLIAGRNNTVGTASLPAYYSACIGENNLISSLRGYVFGYSNEVTGSQGVAIGSGSRAGMTDSTAIGKYNEDMATDDVLVVGTGSNNTVRETALRVKDDATVVLGNSLSGTVVLARAQGDISMGNYQ